MMKRGVASVATSGVETAVHIVINKLIPGLSQGELEVFAKHFDQLLVQSNSPNDAKAMVMEPSLFIRCMQYNI